MELADGEEAPLAPELARVLALQHREVEHAGGADEIDAVTGEIVRRPGLVPLEHASPLPTRRMRHPDMGVFARRGEPWRGHSPARL
jgi:hypothetical protein